MQKEFIYGPQKITIGKFDIKSMADNCTIAIIAKRNSGKSFLTREIMFHKRKVPCAIAISRTEKLNKFYSEFIPDIYIYSEYNSSILSRIYERQLKLIETKKNSDSNQLFLIMDDCMSSKGSWLKDPAITELFFNGRHYKISFILTMQYSVGIPPEMRSNFDYVCLLGEDIISNRKRLYEHYAGMFPTFDIFQKVFSEITDDYGVMIIDNRVHSRDISNRVFWYKSKEVPNFNIGKKSYRTYHDKHYTTTIV
jgi:hypothetical protein